MMKEKLKGKLKEEKSKGKDNDLFTVKIHHGGEFMNVPETIYVGGKIDFINKCDPHKWSLQTLDLTRTKKLGYNGFLGWHFKLPMTETGNGYIQCLTDEDCDLMVKTLPVNRVAEVYITHADNVPKIQTQVSSNANNFCEGNRVQIDLEASKDGGDYRNSNSAKTGISLDDFDVDKESEYFEGDEYHMNESEEESDGVEMDPDSKWLGVWDSTGRDI